MSDAEAAVRERIDAYLRARRAFEMDAYRRMAGLKYEAALAAHEEVTQRFAVYRMEYLAPDAPCVETHARVGTVDADSGEWLTVKVAGDRATARTTESSPSDTTSGRGLYEYRLERQDDRWVLTDRRWKDPASRSGWVRGLL